MTCSTAPAPGAGRRSRSAGFSMIELLIVVGIISILATAATPVLLGAREKARTAGCAHDFAVVAGEMKVRLEEAIADDQTNPADFAIDEGIARFTTDEYTNPRNRNQLAFAKATPGFVPTVNDTCVVFLYDGTEADNPAIVFIQHESAIRSFRISHD